MESLGVNGVDQCRSGVVEDIRVGWDKADFLGNSTLASLALCLCPICGGFWWSPPEDGQEWRGNVVRRWEGPRGGKRAEKL